MYNNNSRVDCGAKHNSQGQMKRVTEYYNSEENEVAAEFINVNEDKTS